MTSPVASTRHGGVQIDLVQGRAWKNGLELYLRRKPFAILEYLVRNPQRIVSQAEIVEAVWGDVPTSGSLLRTHMRDLRRVLGDDVVETVVGRGYRLLLETEAVSVDPHLRVLVLAASVGEDSPNRRLAGVTAPIAERAGASVDLAKLGDFQVPPYDVEGAAHRNADIPPGASALGMRLSESDAFILVAPETNGSMSGGIKNLIDWTSCIRPQPFAGLHGLLLSASTDAGGGQRGLWALRVPLECLGVRVFPETFSIAEAHGAFAGEDLVDPRVRARLELIVRAFLALVEAAKEYPRLKRALAEHKMRAP